MLGYHKLDMLECKNWSPVPRGELGGKRLDLPWRSFHMPQETNLVGLHSFLSAAVLKVVAVEVR